MRDCEVKCKVCQRNSIRPEESEAWPGVVHPSVPIPGSRGIRQGTGLARLIVVFVGLLLPCVLQATTYTVKAGGGGNYTTIQACANATVAGDTCTVYAGTYNEVVTLSHSGTGTGDVCTSCITFRVNPGDTVGLYGFTVAANYVVIQGFTITDPSLSHANAGIYFTGSSTGVHILNNVITLVGKGYPCISTRPGTPSHNLIITGNTISWCSSVPGGGNANASSGASVYADHSLIANNDISKAINGIQLSQPNEVVRNNYYHDTNDAVDFPGCSEPTCDTHIDMIEVTAPTAVNIVIEGNRMNNTFGVGGAHNIIYSASVSGESVHRFNVVYNIGSFLLIAQGGYSGVHSYNNTLVTANLEGHNYFVASWSASSTNGTYLNELMYNVINPPGYAGAYYYTVDAGSTPRFAGGNNLAFDTSCVAGTLAGCTTGRMLTDPGNLYGDPKFVNPASDFHLQAGSPALNAGRYLTTVASADSGSGTSLIVNDAGFFQDGYGISGVQADCIAVTMVTNPVCIMAVNYQTNTLTLASSITRSAGDPVWLYSDSTERQVLFGEAPNIGAIFDVVLPPAPPTNLTAVPQ